MSSMGSSTESITEFFRPIRPKGLTPKNLSSTRLNLLKKEIQTELHLIPLKELYEQLQTDPVKGLSNETADVLLKHYGPNALTPSSKYEWPIVLCRSMCTGTYALPYILSEKKIPHACAFFTLSSLYTITLFWVAALLWGLCHHIRTMGFSILIWFGAALCIIAYTIEASTKSNPSSDNLYLGCVLIAVDIICGLFSFYQNFKSTKIMKTFNSMIPTYATCIREGVMNFEMPVRNLVRGDIVRVTTGDIVPADIRIIESKGFKVDNSSLTGESIAVSRCNTDGTWNILESPNIAFFSTQCVEGWALGLVLWCGDVTALGRVAGLAARLEPAVSPLARELKRLMRLMSIWALVLGLFIAAASLAMGYPFIQTTIFVIGIIVANIPEGLQPTVTAALTITAQHMVTKNCLVKNLEAVEGLGACTTICSDKTGTLTENKMNVHHIWMWNTTYFVKDPEFTNAVPNNRVFTALKICGALCSNANVKSGGGIYGDASETAILNYLFKVDDPIAIRKQYPKVAEIPFNSANKYQVSVHLDSASSQYIVVMKGAPECLFARCATIATGGKDAAMTNDMKAVVEKASENLAVTGERILAFADVVLDPKEYPLDYEFDVDDVNFPIQNLRFIGIMGLMDPPRAEVRAAIRRVRDAGVRVMMITGDHPATARAVALDVGIATDPKCYVITGNELRKLTPDLLNWTLDKHHEIVFARTSPTQKLQIVEACQRQGQVVAVTGDGVNDAPALRRADIGISMGITGSQVSKQTADIILMDDNFATIVTGIEEGRKIFDNLKKSLCYILISNVPEIAPVLMFILFSIPLPLGVMTILCIDLGSDMWPAIALAYERAETDVMARPPRSKDRLVSARMLRLAYGHLGLVEFAAGMYAYFFVMAEHGFYPADLFGIRQRWDNKAVTDLKDSVGQEWSYEERKVLEQACQATYFVAVVVTQMTNGIICKTRYNSFFQVGMKNKILMVGILFELLVSCVVCYTPGLNTFLQTYPLQLHWWFLAIPFCCFMFIFEEIRKYCIRNKCCDGFYNDLTAY